MWRLAAVVVYVFLGLGVGFVLWGNRVSNLTAALNRMMLEDDTLRGRLAHRQNTTGGDGTAVLSTLSLLSAEVSTQADLIDEQLEPGAVSGAYAIGDAGDDTFTVVAPGADCDA